LNFEPLNPLKRIFLRSIRTWVRRIASIAIVVVALFLTLQAILLPMIVRRVLTSAFQQTPYAGATFQVRHSSLWRTDLTDLRLGQQVRIDTIAVDYTPWSLLHGRVGLVRVSGAQIDLTVGAGHAPPLAARAGHAPPLQLPFDRLELRSSTIQVLWDGRPIWVPLEGAITNDLATGGKINLLARVQGLPMQLSGQYDAAWKQFDLTVGAGHALPLATRAGHAPPLLTLAVRRDGDYLLVTAAGQGKDWRVDKLEATVGGLFGPNAPQSYVVQTSFNAQALPAALAPMLALPGIDLAGLGQISAEGAATVKVIPPAKPGQRVAWEASSDNLRLKLAPGDYAANGTNIRGLAGNLTLRGKADNTQAALTIATGSMLWLDQLSRTDLRLVMDKADPTAPLLAITLQGKAAELNLNFANPGDSWRLFVPTANLTLAQADLTAGLDPPTQIEKLGGTLRVRVQAGPTGAEVLALDQSAVAFESLKTVTGLDPMQVGGWKLNLGSQPGEPLLRLSKNDTGLATKIAFRAASESALAVKTKEADVGIAQLQLGGILTLRTGSNPSFVGQLSLQDAAALYKPDNLRLSKISATIPLAYNAQPGPRGPFQIQSIQLAQATYPPLTGTLGIAGQRVEFDAFWPLLKNAARVQALGWVDLGGPEPRGRIDAFLPDFTVTDPQTLSALISNKELAGLDITGTFAGNAQIQFRGSDIKPLVKLTLKDVNVATAEEKSAEGINGTLVIDSFSPFTSQGGQRLTVKKASVGKLGLAEGVLVFRIEAADQFLVEGTDWGWAGGRLYGSSFRLDLNKPRLDLVVTGDKLSLAQVLDTFVGDRITGEGTVYGRLPVTLIWPRVLDRGELVTAWSEPVPELGQGFVYATPGGGWIGMKAPEELLGKGLEGQDPLVRKRIVAAMKALDYSVLKLDLVSKQGEVMGVAYVDGSGRLGRDRQPIDLTFNISGIEEGLWAALKLQRGFSLGQ
jgi:hypothetical protein